MDRSVTQPQRKKKSQLKEIWRRMMKNKLAVAGLVVIIVFAFIAIFADVIADYDTQAIKPTRDLLQAPSPAHWFGTDHLGRDVFARIVHGARISLVIGVATTAISLILGGLLGAIAGYFGGYVDSIIMRIMDMIMCVPAILLALAIIAALGTSITNLLIAITVASVPGFTRIIRSAILTVVGQEYVEAATACGMGEFRIILRHILPNAMGPIIVEATMSVAGMIITAAGLSFLGMGIQPPQPEWGTMLAEARDHMQNHPYLVIFPGLSIILAALSLNLLGDGLRDALDPRLKN
jgi:ABC-type dipeptide/oligopeptide/nickel transport systems, permease components